MSALPDPYAEVQRLRGLIEEFAEFCADSGWPNVAEELRRRALAACEAAPPAPCPECERYKKMLADAATYLQGEEVPDSLKEYLQSEIARHMQPYKSERGRLRAGLSVLREDALALASRVHRLAAGDMAGAVAADGLQRLALGLEALAEGIGAP